MPKPLLRRVLAPPHFFLVAFALVSVTALVAANPGEGIRIENLTFPVSMALFVAFFGWGMSRLVVRDRAQRSLVALAFALLVLGNGYFFGWLHRVLQPSAAEPLQVGLSMVLVAVVILVVRKHDTFEELPRFLNVMGLSLLAFSTPGLLGLANRAPIDAGPPIVPALDSAATRPDIYLIILDAYSGRESLSEIYGFDNSAIYDSLQRRGFVFPESPKANYVKTFLSVASMLNRRYLDDEVARAAPKYEDRRGVYHALEFNQTVIDLKSLGYAFYYVGSSYPPMAANRLADSVGRDGLSRAFEQLWLSTTLFQPAAMTWCRIRGCREIAFPVVESAATTRASVERFTETVSRPGPKFVMLHLLLPHGPFRFGPNCEERPGIWQVGSDSVSDARSRRMYVDQVRCTNRMILRMVDSVLDPSDDVPIVLLQSDHGEGRFLGGVPSALSDSNPHQISERLGVFAAYMGPGAIGDSLATAVSPVNVVRTLFRTLWGVEEPPLKDMAFWSNPDQPLKLVAVESSRRD